MEEVWKGFGEQPTAVGGLLAAELSERLGQLDRRLGELMLKEFGVVQWEFIRWGSSVSAVEI